MINILREQFKKGFRHNKNRSFGIPLDETGEALLPDNHIQVSSHRRSISKCLIRLRHWISTHVCLLIMIVFIWIPILLYLILLILSKSQAFIPKEFQQNHHRLLLIVAHPDDEALFFSPTIRILQKQSHINLSLLVFSRGNYTGLGSIRAKELNGSCQVFNFPQDRCISLDLPNIQDSQKIWWLEERLIPVIDQFINKWSIDVLVSFDGTGVSGHINHRAVGSAVRLLAISKINSKIKMSYELKSVSVLRKYSSLLDLYIVFITFTPYLMHLLFSHLIPLKLISSPNLSSMLLINTPKDYMVSRAAFASHNSQFSWDRYVYLVASRFMFINELKYIDK